MDQPTNRITEITPWELLEEEDVSPSRYFPTFKQTVKIHNGKIIDDYFVCKLSDGAMVVAITPLKEIIMVRQWRQGVQEISLELPAGQNDGRLPIDTARSELLEEAKVVTTTLHPLGAVANITSKSSIRIHGFFCYVESFTNEQNLDETENIEIIKVPLRDLDFLITSGKIVAADTISCIFLAKLKFPDAFLL